MEAETEQEELRFNHMYLATHGADRKWGGEPQLRAVAQHFEVDVVVLDQEAPDSLVMLVQCHMDRVRRFKDWAADIVPRLARQRAADWPRADERPYPLVVLHWVMARCHYEPALRL